MLSVPRFLFVIATPALALAGHKLAGLPIAVAAIGGALLALGGLLLRRPVPAPAPAATLQTRTDPDPTALLSAIPDPLLLVRDGIVERANPAAHTLLGGHIAGQDVRLAIRHPAAAERLARDRDGPPIPLVGLGELDRRWELDTTSLGDGLRLVRLADRTGMHAAERMRVDFVANASHELRTPLAALLGYIETLADEAGADPVTRARFLGIMLGEAKRMHRLVDDLISLSRIEADRFTPPRAATSLPALAEEVRASWPDARDRIRLAIAPGLPDVIGDRSQLSQVLHNLIGNAMKYGRSDAPVDVTFDPAPGNVVRIAVQDEGDGIALEHIPRLTERFYRVDPGRSRAAGGTGLGLAIVKHIVERHRGRLEIESEVGRGTRVVVLLPAVVPTDDAVTELSSISHMERREAS